MASIGHLAAGVAHGIIQEHGGRLDVERQVGKGTVFTIRLPLEVDNAL